MACPLLSAHRDLRTSLALPAVNDIDEISERGSSVNNYLVRNVGHVYTPNGRLEEEEEHAEHDECEQEETGNHQPATIH
jgi:hypothetical protein